MSRAKTILLVDDDIGTLRVLRDGLTKYLAEFDLLTATNGREAADQLAENEVDIVITDLAMPVMDGFELLAYMQSYHSDIPALVITVMQPEQVEGRLAPQGMLRVLHKPVNYRVLGDEVREVLSEAGRGKLEGISLVGIAQLVEMERKSCSLLVTAGDSKGRLHFLSGTLVNAYAFDLDAEGEEAACNILAWDDVKIQFERSLHNNRRLIQTPLQTLLFRAAQHRDEQAVAAKPS